MQIWPRRDLPAGTCNGSDIGGGVSRRALQGAFVMGRLRKDYRLVPTPEPLIGKPGTLVVNMLDGDGKLERSFDFSAYAAGR